MDLENEESKKIIFLSFEKDRKIISLEHDLEILQEQLESLKQELLEERQRAEDYRQELIYTQLELEELERELLNMINLEMLEASKVVQDDLNLKSQNFSRSDLESPIKFYRPEELPADKNTRQELISQLRSERNRLRKHFKDLSQQLGTLTNYSSDLIKQINKSTIIKKLK